MVILRRKIKNHSHFGFGDLVGIYATYALTFLMDRGEVTDTGTHEELLERGGIYADLYRLQFQDGKAVVDRDHARALGQDEIEENTASYGLLARIKARLTRQS